MLQIRTQLATRRPVTDLDLIETLDIGSNAELDPNPMFSLSPDQSRIAVGVRRADAVGNNYCSGIYVIDREGGAQLIDSSPDAAFWRFPDYYGTTGFPTGFFKLITPRWSPDGKSLGFLKFVDGRLQLWLWNEKAPARAIAQHDTDILDFRFTPNGQGIVYRIADVTSSDAALEREALSGFHFDERYVPVASNRPFPPGPQRLRDFAIRLSDGASRQASDSEVSLFKSVANSTIKGDLQVDTEKDANGVYRIALTKNGKRIACSSAACTEIEGQPWITSSGTARWVSREGWGKSRMAIYEWRIDAREPRKLYSTSDLLMNCGPLGADIVCAREGSTRPRYLDRINARTGRSAALFDPNPAFAELALGRVERMTWKNDRDIECFGDLVYPPDYKSGQRYPLIVVQYESRGFLRGGTGDEYPVQLFAREGYLVLTVQRPRSPYFGLGLASAERQRRQLKDFDERRSILSAIETKVKQLITAEVADPDRIGLTGLSDGSTTVQYAALHSELFKAASVSGCCWVPSQTWLLGPAIQAHNELIGWPASPDSDPNLWAAISLARNAPNVRFPILIQAADVEYLASLESVRALRLAGHPVDLFVFPREHHFKQQPAHKVALYRRNIDWFNFWLLDKRPQSNEPAAEEASRWLAMLERWSKRP
jgi:dipeptidyl aminopeptidase/acylaminoacyl peptidase